MPFPRFSIDVTRLEGSGGSVVASVVAAGRTPAVTERCGARAALRALRDDPRLSADAARTRF
jgi:hypothetical protein